MDLDLCLHTANQDASGKFQTKGKVCYRCVKGRHQPAQKCGAIKAICNKCGKAIMQESVKRERDFHILLGLHM